MRKREGRGRIRNEVREKGEGRGRRWKEREKVE